MFVISQGTQLITEPFFELGAELNFVHVFSSASRTTTAKTAARRSGASEAVSARYFSKRSRQPVIISGSRKSPRALIKLARKVAAVGGSASPAPQPNFSNVGRKNDRA